MWIRHNPNPAKKEVPDCVIRAISTALGLSWLEVYDELCWLGRIEFNMPSADAVWGKYLYSHGFEPFLLPISFQEDNKYDILFAPVLWAMK